MRLPLRLSLEWLVIGICATLLVGALSLIAVPRVLGWQGVVVLSGSMEPALQTGGLAFIAPAQIEYIREGDIVTFNSESMPGSMVTHRVVEVISAPEGISLRTKGDANEAVDAELVTAESLIGTVRFDLNYVGYVVDALRNRDNFYIFVGIPVVLLVLSELWSIAHELRSRHREGQHTVPGGEKVELT